VNAVIAVGTLYVIHYAVVADLIGRVLVVTQTVVIVVLPIVADAAIGTTSTVGHLDLIVADAALEVLLFVTVRTVVLTVHSATGVRAVHVLTPWGVVMLVAIATRSSAPCCTISALGMKDKGTDIVVGPPSLIRSTDDQRPVFVPDKLSYVKIRTQDSGGLAVIVLFENEVSEFATLKRQLAVGVAVKAVAFVDQNGLHPVMIAVDLAVDLLVGPHDGACDQPVATVQSSDAQIRGICIRMDRVKVILTGECVLAALMRHARAESTVIREQVHPLDLFCIRQQLDATPMDRDLCADLVDLRLPKSRDPGILARLVEEATEPCMGVVVFTTMSQVFKVKDVRRAIAASHINPRATPLGYSSSNVGASLSKEIHDVQPSHRAVLLRVLKSLALTITPRLVAFREERLPKVLVCRVLTAESNGEILCNPLIISDEHGRFVGRYIVADRIRIIGLANLDTILHSLSSCYAASPMPAAKSEDRIAALPVLAPAGGDG
jgi:hypothetical protein